MTIEIKTELKPNYAHVYCTGIFKSDAMLEVWQNAFRIAVSEGRKTVLDDVRGIHGKPPTVCERYDHGVRIAELQRRLDKEILIAVVGSKPMIESERLAENIARNHGAFMRAFTDIDETVAWVEAEVANVTAREKSLRWPPVSAAL